VAGSFPGVNSADNRGSILTPAAVGRNASSLSVPRLGTTCYRHLLHPIQDSARERELLIM
jgi:hypothetical protein